jgi:hypothetical protein
MVESLMIRSIIDEAIILLRTTRESGQIQILHDVATKIFGLLAPKWDEPETRVSPFQLIDALETTLNCVDWVYMNSGREDLPWFSGERSKVFKRLDAEVNQRCWNSIGKVPLPSDRKRRLEIHPKAPDTPHATRTRAPQTATRHRIENLLNRVENEIGIKVYKKDFWLRPTRPDGTSHYNSDKEFRAFQREDPKLKPGIKKLFLDVLKMPPEKFIESLEERRAALEARKKAKSPR